MYFVRIQEIATSSTATTSAAMLVARKKALGQESGTR